jgi:hypothetical protein
MTALILRGESILASKARPGEVITDVAKLPSSAEIERDPVQLLASRRQLERQQARIDAELRLIDQAVVRAGVDPKAVAKRSGLLAEGESEEEQDQRPPRVLPPLQQPPQRVVHTPVSAPENELTPFGDGDTADDESEEDESEEESLVEEEPEESPAERRRREAAERRAQREQEEADRRAQGAQQPPQP